MAEGELATWDEIFGSLDARTLGQDGRIEFLNREFLKALDDRHQTLSIGGEEVALVWDAAVEAFIAANWVAAILCCQAACERMLAETVSLRSIRNNFPKGWDRGGMGELLGILSERGIFPDDLINDLRQLANARKPFGHWRPPSHSTSMWKRQASEAQRSGNVGYDENVERLIVADATHAVRTTMWMRYGGFSL